MANWGYTKKDGKIEHIVNNYNTIQYNAIQCNGQLEIYNLFNYLLSLMHTIKVYNIIQYNNYNFTIYNMNVQ